MLNEYAVKMFGQLNKPTIVLSVSKTNERAIAFYQINGWINTCQKSCKYTEPNRAHHKRHIGIRNLQ